MELIKSDDGRYYFTVENPGAMPREFRHPFYGESMLFVNSVGSTADPVYAQAAMDEGYIPIRNPAEVQAPPEPQPVQEPEPQPESVPEVAEPQPEVNPVRRISRAAQRKALANADG